MLGRVGFTWALFLMGVLAGCAPRGPSASRGGAGPGVISVEAQVLPAGSERVRVAGPGEVLHDGDQLALRVEASAPAYLHVVHASSGGAPEVLCPAAKAGPPRVAGRAPVYLPDAGKWFAVDARPGDEVFYVLAAPRPLSAEQITAEVRKAPARGLDRDRDDPKEMDEKHRPGVNKVWRAQMDPAGVTLLRLSFRHE